MTILEQIFGGWQYGSVAPVLYYYAQDNFTAADGELVVKGSLMIQIIQMCVGCRS